MKLANETNIDGRALRRFVAAGLRAEGMDPRGYRVRVRWLRANARTVGWGYYDSHSMTLLVDRPERGATEIPAGVVRRLAHTLVHEVAHNRGLRHSEMDCRRHAEEVTAWLALGATLPLRAPRAKPTKDQRVEARLSVVEGRLADWRRKLKLARTKVRKYEAAQKRAVGRLAALRDAPAEPRQ